MCYLVFNMTMFVFMVKHKKHLHNKSFQKVDNLTVILVCLIYTLNFLCLLNNNNIISEMIISEL